MSVPADGLETLADALDEDGQDTGADDAGGNEKMRRAALGETLNDIAARLRR